MAHPQKTGRAAGRTAAFMAGVVTLSIGLYLSLGLWLPQASGADPAPADGTKTEARIIGPYDAQDGCEKCHVKELAAWQASSHFLSMEKLYKDGKPQDGATAILDKLRAEQADGVSESKDPRMSARCARCHATTYLRPEREVGLPAWGVSCESCHGPAQHWVHKHSAFKVSGRLTAKQKQEAEKPEDRLARRKEASDHGMVRGDNMYQMARNCLGCHIVADAQIVSHGHKSGSAFDLVSWSQGEVRHNFLKGAKNRKATPARRRVMYVTGALADLEMSTRAVAKASEEGKYLIEGKARLLSAAKLLLKIEKTLADDGATAKGVAEAAMLVATLKKRGIGKKKRITVALSKSVRHDNEAELTGLADKIEAIASPLAASLMSQLGGDGGADFMSALDTLITAPPKGDAFEGGTTD